MISTSRAAVGLDMQHQLAGIGGGRNDARPRRQGEVAAAPGGTGAAPAPARCARAAMKTCAWRTKPQTTPKRASTSSPLMIMTMTQAVRRLVAGREDWLNRHVRHRIRHETLPGSRAPRLPVTTMPAGGWTVSWPPPCPIFPARAFSNCWKAERCCLGAADDKRRQPPGQTGRPSP